jgi:copper homeostasis protein
MRVVVEVCVSGIESARAAQAGGADRVELCDHFEAGGVTPSAGAIAVACRRLTIPVHVLIRPRAGDFRYTEAEFVVMSRDVAYAKAAGAAGVVLGLLVEDGSIDRPRTAELIALARPMSVTFHKAFDEVGDPVAALEELVSLDVDRILTSGRARTAREGLETLGNLAQRAASRLVVMAGGGISESDVPSLVGAGLRELHVGSSVMSESETGGRHGRVAATDPEKVRAFVRLAWSSADC